MADVSTALPFKKFGSIKNTDSSDGEATIQAYGELEAVALEKAHGAHFSFQTDGDRIECARRGDVLNDEDSFYNHLDFVAKYSKQISQIFSEISSMLQDIRSIQVDGEFIGGSYSHPDVERNNECARVQKGVFYSPNHAFYAYDIRCFRVEADGEESSFYVDYDAVASVFEKVGMLYARPVARGTFAELCEISNVFESKISTELSLPQIESNKAEGLIIRPIVERVLRTGSRVILKSKNPKFAETIRMRDPDKKSKTTSIDPDVASCIDSMVVLNRLSNVISKIGQVEREDFGKIMCGLNCDVLKDFSDEYPEIHATIGKKDWPAIKKYMNRKCSALINEYFMSR
jgi:Rnl2 family RNA ligase